MGALRTMSSSRESNVVKREWTMKAYNENKGYRELGARAQQDTEMIEQGQECIQRHKNRVVRWGCRRIIRQPPSSAHLSRCHAQCRSPRYTPLRVRLGRCRKSWGAQIW